VRDDGQVPVQVGEFDTVETHTHAIPVCLNLAYRMPGCGLPLRYIRWFPVLPREGETICLIGDDDIQDLLVVIEVIHFPNRDGKFQGPVAELVVDSKWSPMLEAGKVVSVQSRQKKE